MLCGPRSTTPGLLAYFALLFFTCVPILKLLAGVLLLIPDFCPEEPRQRLTVSKSILLV